MRAKRDIVRNTIHFVGRISLISPRSRLIRCRRLIDCLKFFAFAPSYSKRRPTSSRREAQKWITRLLLITRSINGRYGLVNVHYARQSE